LLVLIESIPDRQGRLGLKFYVHESDGNKQRRFRKKSTFCVALHLEVAAACYKYASRR